MTAGSVISLFTGGMGLDLGFEDAGFEVKVSVEKAPRAVETIKTNRPLIPVISRDIQEVTTAEILEKAQLIVGEVTVLTGASPCEPFSTAGHRRSVQDSRAETVDEFIRVINDTRPRYFVFEQVPGFMRAAKRHISFYERVKKRPEELHPDERLGSAFEEIMVQFRDTGYALSYSDGEPQLSILNAADYGTPQKRKRFVLIGAREEPPISLPQKTHGAPDSPEVISGVLKPWVTLRDALAGLNDPRPEYPKFSNSWGKYLAFIPPGGCWRDLPEKLHKEALGGAYDETGSNLKGGRTGFLRRLAWTRPAPTIVDRPNTKASCLCHPEEDRPLSVKEYARLQGFPDDWEFAGPLPARYELIGQATPVQLAQALARVISQRLGCQVIEKRDEPEEMIITV
jgi:DNA (cytosine-5)-methyltransferase 1